MLPVWHSNIKHFNSQARPTEYPNQSTKKTLADTKELNELFHEQHWKAEGNIRNSMTALKGARGDGQNVV